MPSIKARIYAFFTGRSPEDWQGEPGKEFRNGADTIADFCRREGIMPDGVAQNSGTAISVAAPEKLTRALNEAAEAQKRLIETALIIRSADNTMMESQPQRQEFDNSNAYVELVEKFHKLNVVVVLDESGVTHFLPSPDGFDIRQAPALTQGMPDELPDFNGLNVDVSVQHPYVSSKRRWVPEVIKVGGLGEKPIITGQISHASEDPAILGESDNSWPRPELPPETQA